MAGTDGAAGGEGALPVAPGLHLVATPIGAARDITLRALDILRGADILAAEDTRSLRRLLAIHGIAVAGRPLWSYHDHSDGAVRARIVSAIAGGQSVVYAAEAGTPLISDPGFALAAAVRAGGGAVLAAPGASALLAALAVAGLPTDRFLFLGFLPPKRAARRRALDRVAGLRATLVAYEAPSRVHETFSDMAQSLGGTREAALCRELTKRFEEVRRDTLAGLAAATADLPPRGECVLVVGPPAEAREPGDDELREALAALPAGTHLRDAARQVADRFGVPRKRVYALGLALRDGGVHGAGDRGGHSG